MSLSGKVLQVIPSLAASDGGPSRALRLFEQALSGAGVNTETATTDHGLHNGDVVASAVDGARHYFALTTRSYKFSWRYVCWMLAHVEDYRLVHVHALFSFLPLFACWAARRRGVPYIIRPLGTLAAYGLERRRPWLKHLSLRWIEGPLLRDAAAVQFTSEQERREAENLGIQMRSAVLPLAVQADAVGDVARGSAPLRVLFLSRLDRKKNIEGLLLAISLCRSEFPEVRWRIAGGGEPAYMASLQALAAELGIADAVDWLGAVHGADKRTEFAMASFFVLPSFSENFGIAAAEAMQAGLPVVLGEGVALASLAERDEAGLAVKPEAEAIAAALIRLLSDAELRCRMSENARRLAQREFSMDTMGRRLVGLYKAILAAPDRKLPFGYSV